MCRTQAEVQPGGVQGSGSGGERDHRAGAWQGHSQYVLEGGEKEEMSLHADLLLAGRKKFLWGWAGGE